MKSMFKSGILACLLIVSQVGATEDASGREELEQHLKSLLTDFHQAASDADGERYFSLFAPNAVFLGTSPEERWTFEEFMEFARPYFDSGRGWTYTALSRNIEVAPGGDIAWFDEVLNSEKYGLCRGSGVLTKVEGEWKIAQYNLALLVPNEIALDVVDLIRHELEKGDSD
jgi:hypothetical protein